MPKVSDYELEHLDDETERPRKVKRTKKIEKEKKYSDKKDYRAD